MTRTTQDRLTAFAVSLLAVAAAGCGLRAPSPAAAQVPTLQAVDSLVTVGDYENARRTLERWWSAREQFDVPGSDMARALMLRGQLAADPEAAEPHYLAVVLGYPTSPHAPDALLRLGQGLLATGDASRAVAYLDRLVADFPGRAQRSTALLWLARANSAANRPGAACQAARNGLEDTREPDLAEMLRLEAAASCGIGSRAQEDQPAGKAAAHPASPPAERTAEPRADRPASDGSVDQASQGSWAVQTGAFRYRTSADALLERLRAAGFEPRLVLVPRSDLLRVRIGRFEDVDAARALVRRLQAAGFEAVPVSDAGRERRP